MSVKPKKHLGQHFLKEEGVCQKIANAIAKDLPVKIVLEVGPGMGALTKYLLQNNDFETHAIELDYDSVDYLNENYPDLRGRIYSQDFLKTDIGTLIKEPFSVVGNFPYNISSQILFKVLEYKNQIPVVTGMFQKELAERIAEPPGSKKYGIISVLLQAWYDIEYLFTVNENAFIPPPKVKSAAIKLTRNSTQSLDCDEKMFIRVVKISFNQRRKTLRNSLKPLINEVNKDFDTSDALFNRRPETLSVDEFISLTQRLIV